MTSKERLLTAASFREADRVPVELLIGHKEKQMPCCSRIADFIQNHADNFMGVPSAKWGFMGLESVYSEEIIEDRPGEYRRLKRVYSTEAGEFFAVTRHLYPHIENPDYIWEKRYISSLEDFERLVEAPRKTIPLLTDKYFDAVKSMGEKGVPIASRFHPLGSLVRKADMEKVYAWLLTEPALVHRFLETTNCQVCNTIEAMGKAGMSPWFITYAHEMLIPPWLGLRHFEELVVPYDKSVNEAIHSIGGKVRAHCHGRCMAFLPLMSDMGIDSVEPLEPEPFGDVDLREAKKLVGDRMLLSGNIPSQNFFRMTRAEVDESVKNAIHDAGSGGGFTLKPTGGGADISVYLEPAMLEKAVENVEAYIDAALKYGQYPL